MRTTFSTTTLVALLALAAAGCRGNRGEDPPIHPQQNMDFQQKFEAQEKNERFADKRAMRAPPVGTVAVGLLKDDHELWEARGIDGRLLDTMPVSVELTPELLRRGQERYEIFCAACHGETGHGNGMVTRRGGGFKVPPPTYHTDRMRAMPLGYVVDVITKGRGTMLPYASQVLDPKDRWAIAAWVRTLQVSQAASADDVPPEAQAQASAAGAKGQ